MSRSQASSQEHGIAQCHQLFGLEQTHVFPISIRRDAHENMIIFPVPIFCWGAK